MLALCVTAIGSCTRITPTRSPCAGSDQAQCEFERAIAAAKAQEAEELALARKEREQTQLRGWAWADVLLEDLSRTLADGMQVDVVHSRAHNYCRFEVGASHGAQESWACPLESPLELGDTSFVLEYSPDGVLSLASDKLDAPTSNALLDQAIERWRSRCQFKQFEQVEGDTHHEIYRCALADGPLLVLGRFDRDLDADRWQLSFAMVAVG